MTGGPECSWTATRLATPARRRAEVRPSRDIYLELSGNTPFVVFDDANVDTAVEGAIAAS